MTNLYKRLYKLHSNGIKLLIWEIHISDDCKYFYTVSGQVGGKLIQSKPTRVIPKVKRSQKEQVELEADQKINIKLRQKYVETRADVAKAEKVLPGYSAMLAKKWEDQKSKIKYPAYVQPKLDGVRCLATIEGLFTRSRKPIEACEHIRAALAPFFASNPKARLDGELYSHVLKNDFESIVKSVRKTNKHATPEDLIAQAKLHYYIYDVPRISDLTESSGFFDRYYEFSEYCNPNVPEIVVVETCMVFDEEELYEVHNEFLAVGYEGTMVRNMSMPYKGSRSSELLKIKEFNESEFEILGVNEGKGGLTGHAATFDLEMRDGAPFRAKMKGSVDTLKRIWENPNSVISKMCTVVYQGLTNKEGVPRFPVVKCIRGSKDGTDWM